MKIDERKALNTQKPQSEKVYETKSDVSSRTAKKSFAGLEKTAWPWKARTSFVPWR